ncbi:GGDEF domain-containing protein [Pseudomonas sp. HR96]|uniref:GGDEF domain-containing protein n=1 Tax=Pseudomonas sp. HR96 TaxID=1027966 RepID=UPI002A765C3C|nr:GGDEF domain-containing protein [Pseudomonas sp. HR96]WPO97972.1 GGDEF domain-containing protein [Pseudomonas sp. HR96]
MLTSAAAREVAVNDAPDLFESENEAVQRARAIAGLEDAEASVYRASLLELTGHFERLMRETRRLIGRSDRAEREMNSLNLQLNTLAQQLEYRATHDALTGILNRGAIIEKSVQALARCGAVMIVLDIDHFKRINDEFGHPAGDAVIRGIVDCLRRIVGDTGLVGRVGGEEFTVLVPGGSLAQGLTLAEAMRRAIAEHRFAAPVERQVTASFGISACAAGTHFDTAYGMADAALYQAKRAGRNAVQAALAPRSEAIDQPS